MQEQSPGDMSVHEYVLYGQRVLAEVKERVANQDSGPENPKPEKTTETDEQDKTTSLSPFEVVDVANAKRLVGRTKSTEGDSARSGDNIEESTKKEGRT